MLTYSFRDVAYDVSMRFLRLKSPSSVESQRKMAEIGGRTMRLTNEETKLLVNLIMQRRDVLESKKTDAVTNAAKARSWKEVEMDFNSHEFVRKRKDKQLRKSWENVKVKRRKALAQERQERMRTGGGPMPSTSTSVELPPEVEIALPSVSYSPRNAGDSDMFTDPNISPARRDESPECVFFEEAVEDLDPQLLTCETPTLVVGHVAEVQSVKRRAPISRGAAIEKEMEVRLQNLASCKENEEALQLLRLKEAQLAIAVKEQELASAKAAGDIQQQEADFRRRILEAQLHVEEAKLQRVVILT